MIEKPLLERERSLFIRGEWRSPTAPQPITAVDPSTGSAPAHIDGAGAADVDAAVAAAADAFTRWRQLSSRERVPTDNPLWREEIFGPVLAVRTFDSETEAVALANDTAFGLVATVVNGDPQRADRVAAKIDAGHIWINSMQVIFPHTAWGGFKASGIGPHP